MRDPFIMDILSAKRMLDSGRMTEEELLPGLHPAVKAGVVILRKDTDIYAKDYLWQRKAGYRSAAESLELSGTIIVGDEVEKTWKKLQKMK